MRTQILTLLVLIFNCVNGSSQKIDCSVPKEYVIDSIIDGQSIKYLKDGIKDIRFCVVEKNAEFQGGDILKFRDWVMKNIDKRSISSDTTIHGKLNFLFIISREGKMSDIIISRGICQKIDKEVYEVINSSPDWKPAKKGGKNSDQLIGLQIIINNPCKK